MRPLWTVVHRWIGLFIAGFLFFSGLTGAIISWDHALDDWINPQLMKAKTAGVPRSALELADLVEARHPDVKVTYFALAPDEPGASWEASVSPRVDPMTQRLYEPGFNQVFLDPVSGEELGRREWGAAWPVTKENFVSFLYRLHYTMHVPEFWGIDRWGMWLLGVVAVVWTLDCFVGAYLTLPLRRRKREADDVSGDAIQPRARSFWARWKPAWKVRWSGGATKLSFDLHRAFSLWTWALLFIVAFTGFSLNLYREVFFPMMSMVSKVTPTPFDERKARDKHRPIEARVGRAETLAIAAEEGKRRGYETPLSALSYSPQYGIYQARFFEPADDGGAGGVGPTRLYIDGVDGRVLGDRLPWRGTAADIFVQAQFPLHSGRILGIPGRIVVSAIGVVVAMLSVTGVVIWWKKLRARGRHPVPARVGSDRRGRVGFETG